MRAAQERGLSLAQPEEFEAVAGHGIMAVVDGRTVLLGNLKLMRERNVPIAEIEGEVERLRHRDAHAGNRHTSGTVRDTPARFSALRSAW